jgi:hypothetical protein
LEGKKLYLYEEEKSQKQQGQHLYLSVARTVPTPRFDCVVYLLHVLDRRFLGES